MKIRLWGIEAECRAAVERLMVTPGLVVLSVSGPYADRGASVMVRVFIEARLDPPAPGPERVTATTGPARSRRAALPPGAAQ